MAVNCDFIIMADTASIAFPETGLGTFVGGGVTYHLPPDHRPGQGQGIDYTGRILNGPEAVDIGLAFRSTPIDNLMKEAMDLAGLMAGKAPVSMAFAKNQIQKALLRDLDTALLVEAEAILACMNTEDWQEGIDSFAEKRPPVYKGK